MMKPAYEIKLENMPASQRDIIIAAAYDDGVLWRAIADLYRFDESETQQLRLLIFEKYRPDGQVKRCRSDIMGSAKPMAGPARSISDPR